MSRSLRNLESRKTELSQFVASFLEFAVRSQDLVRCSVEPLQRQARAMFPLLFHMVSRSSFPLERVETRSSADRDYAILEIGLGDCRSILPGLPSRCSIQSVSVTRRV